MVLDRVRVKLLRDVRLDGVEPKRWRFDARKSEQVVGDQDIGLSEDRVRERDSSPKG
jgi:hypothetical protein